MALGDQFDGDDICLLDVDLAEEEGLERRK